MRLQRGKKVEITRQLSPDSAMKLARWIGCYLPVLEEFACRSRFSSRRTLP
jgi:hypothetical protein